MTVNAVKLPGYNSIMGGFGHDINYGSITSAIGIGAGIGEQVMSSTTLGTWLGKDWKFHSQTWGGNQYTGGKLAFAGKYASYFKWAGNVAAAIDQIILINSYWQGDISGTQFWIGTGSNAIGAIPFYGLFWSIGWEAGRYTSQWLNNR